MGFDLHKIKNALYHSGNNLILASDMLVRNLPELQEPLPRSLLSEEAQNQ
jgi:hypothetical protein